MAVESSEDLTIDGMLDVAIWTLIYCFFRFLGVPPEMPLFQKIACYSGLSICVYYIFGVVAKALVKLLIRFISPKKRYLRVTQTGHLEIHSSFRDPDPRVGNSCTENDYITASSSSPQIHAESREADTK